MNTGPWEHCICDIARIMLKTALNTIQSINQSTTSSTQVFIKSKITWHFDLYFLITSLFLWAVSKCFQIGSVTSNSSTILVSSLIARIQRWCFLTTGSIDKWWHNTVRLKHSVGNLGSCHGGEAPAPTKIHESCLVNTLPDNFIFLFTWDWLRALLRAPHVGAKAWL